MKETQIAKENVEGCGEEREFTNRSYYCGKLDSKNKLNWCDECERVIDSHKQSCQRLLEFFGNYSRELNSYPKKSSLELEDFFSLDKIIINTKNKITDLQNAIKTYKDAGIK